MTVISRLQFNHPGNTTRAGYGWHFRLWALIVLYLANYKKQKNKKTNKKTLVKAKCRLTLKLHFCGHNNYSCLI